ncbi:uncharacterized protein LOC123548151 [Mercenaria mercenaria]|uniref:uncharacterized protein LOC123548151 n=1 Tax=Mercenaria mercenaria TaxID=6596 RepID=UPI00234F5A0A|nr:uncharacterized protein LOC123548151 [Mercenaria mercenaria]
MFQAPGHSQSVSLKLSEVLRDIGVNERMLLKRRRMLFLKESLANIVAILNGENRSKYIFGSQTEGSTTVGLKSDLDELHCSNVTNVIRDWTEWQIGVHSYMMFKNESTSPGYCFLQPLSADEPSVCKCYVHRTSVCADRRGRFLMKNSFKFCTPHGYFVVNGPADTYSKGHTSGIDHVSAFQCKSWPKEAKIWLTQRGIGGWPTDEIKRYCETTGCFVVPVGSKHSENEEVEWRVSTSKASGCLMLSLNITQLRCYILMKMILKTFINPQCDGVLSSFMCKTVLFHCIKNTHLNQWQEHNLLACLKCCLMSLRYCVRQLNCPHFIIPENNLMAGRISPPVQQQLLTILEAIIQSEFWALIDIPIDDLGMRLQEKMNMLPVYPCGHYYHSSADMSPEASGDLIHHVFNDLDKACQKIYSKTIILARNRHEMVPFLLLNSISSVARLYNTEESTTVERAACRLTTPFLCSSLGSVMASLDIRASNSISEMALAWFSAGLNSDMSSSRLKLASALYCIGEMERAEYILGTIEEKYDLDVVVPVHRYSPCTLSGNGKPGFINKCNTGNEELIKDTAAFSVQFMRCEINCVPQELQYEMFRSTQEDLLVGRDKCCYWLDWAVVDSLPYLYFLQYKTYRHLQRGADQQRALLHLATTIDTDPNLGHRETALNLLGQCLEQENRYDAALSCYIKSRNIRTRNNAANYHICKLLSVFFPAEG